MARWGEMSGKDQIIFCILSIPFFVSFGAFVLSLLMGAVGIILYGLSWLW